jgi:glyoxylase-like metal-dependent hydrolase (beta-lactamase superfamily II)
MSAITLPVAAEWFDVTEVGDGVTRITEPHVHPMLRANFWHVRGRDRDLIVDCGLGVASLRTALPSLFAHDPVLVLTHAHLDHMGSAHEFDDCWAHPGEPVGTPGRGSLDGPTLARLLGVKQPLPAALVAARPGPAFDPAGYRLAPATVTRHLRDGDVVDLGDRRFTVLHVPGHSPGGVALYDEATRTLFSGDTIYDDELLDDIDGADPATYRRSMHRLRELPVQRCHGGHADSIDGPRLQQIIDDYLTTSTTRG